MNISKFIVSFVHTDEFVPSGTGASASRFMTNFKTNFFLDPS